MKIAQMYERSRPYLLPAMQSLAIRFGGLALQFGVSIYTARLLGAAGFGVYVFAFTVATMAGAMFSAGLTQMAVREIATLVVQGRFGRLRGWFRVHAATLAASSAVATLGLWLLERSGWLVSPIGWPGLAFAATCQAVMLALSQTLNGLHRLQISQIVEMLVRPLVFVGLTFVLMRLGYDPTASLLFWSSVGALVLALPILLWTAAREVRRQIPDPAPAIETDPRGWLREARPFFLSIIVATLQINVTTLILGYYGTAAELGVFRAAARGIDLVVIATTITSVVLSPMLARAVGAGDRAAAQRLISDSALLACALGLPVCLVLFVFAPQYLALFGDEFADGVPLMRWLAAAQVVALLTGPTNTILVMLGRQSQVLRAITLSLTATVLAALVLVPIHGGQGAAWSTIVGSLAFSGLLLTFVLRDGRYDPTPFAALRRLGLL